MERLQDPEQDILLLELHIASTYSVEEGRMAKQSKRWEESGSLIPKL